MNELHGCTRLKCRMAVTQPPRTCRVVKWLAAVGYLGGWVMIWWSARKAEIAGISEEYGVMLALRTFLITALFIVQMWSMNYMIGCAARGGLVKGEPGGNDAI